MTWTYETERIGEDGDRLAHNPEVAGSNPVPATSVPATRETAPGGDSGGRFHVTCKRICEC